MLIVTYGETKYKIMLNQEEMKEVKRVCEKLGMEHTKLIQLMFRYALCQFGIWTP